MKPLSVSFSATSSVYSRIGYETVLDKWDHNADLFDISAARQPPELILGSMGTGRTIRRT